MDSNSSDYKSVFLKTIILVHNNSSIDPVNKWIASNYSGWFLLWSWSHVLTGNKTILPLTSIQWLFQGPTFSSISSEHRFKPIIGYFVISLNFITQWGILCFGWSKSEIFCLGEIWLMDQEIMYKERITSLLVTRIKWEVLTVGSSSPTTRTKRMRQ